MNETTEETTVVEEETTSFCETPVFQYVVAPLAVFGAWKLGSAAARKLRDRRAPRATVVKIERNEETN